MTTLIVQTPGDAVADANSYLDVTAADALAVKYGMATWTAYTGDKSVALFQGANYLEVVYGPQFNGRLVSTTQAMSFPRTKFYTTTGKEVAQGEIPEAILLAQLQLATVATTENLFAAPSSNSNLSELTQSVDGAVSRTQKWFSPNTVSESKTYSAGMVLTPYLNSSSNGRTVRA